MPNLFLLQQQFNAQITSLQTLMNDLTNRVRDQNTHFDRRLTTLATSQQELTTHVTDLRQDQTTIITDIQRIDNNLSSQQAMATVVQNLDTVIRHNPTFFVDPSVLSHSPTCRFTHNLISRRCAKRYQRWPTGLLAKCIITRCDS